MTLSEAERMISSSTRNLIFTTVRSAHQVSWSHAPLNAIWQIEIHVEFSISGPTFRR